MTRRDLVDLLLRSSTVPAFASFFADWMQAAGQHSGTHSAAPPERTAWNSYRPKFFDTKDFEALQAMTEILIPTNDTPGAREAHCAHFIDFLLDASGTHGAATQQQWKQALSALRDAGFHGANAAERARLVEVISLPERDRTKQHPAFNAYLLIKRENAFAFYTSRAGMIGALDYRGNSFNATFPACEHPEHHEI